MKSRTGISLILALLVVLSAFTIVDAIQAFEGGDPLCAPINVNKKVWDGTDWAETITSYYGEIVTFNITITYHKNCEDGICATDIQAIDTLPSFLDYTGNANYEHSFVDGNLVQWNLTDDYGIFLEDGESVSIEFDAEVADYGVDINSVEVTAYESCCGWSLYGEDDVTVNVVDALVVDKEVYDPETDEWVDEHLGIVKKVDPLKFRINITYNGYYDVDLMKCMVVEDFLPECCLEYINGSEDFTYPDTQLFDDPDIIVSQDLKYVKYDWANKKFNLYAKQSIVIEFEVTVVEYCYDTVDNCADVEIYNCLACPDPVILTDSDCATVNCYPPDSSIDKRVWDPDEAEWVKEISVYVGDTVTYRINLTYYGNYNFSDISILDQLHCAMEYIEGSAKPLETDISGNMIWWNFTEPLNDGETLTIEFDAEAVVGTGCEAGANLATVFAYEQNKPVEDSDNTAKVKVISNLPPFPPDITGDTEGFEDEELTFKAITLDPDGDQVYYIFDWGDGTQSDWLGPYNSGEETEATKSWDNAGTYYVKAKAKDSTLGDESVWSFYLVTVEIVEPPVLSLNVTIKHGLGLFVSANIENNGEAELTNINWNLTVERKGIIFKKTLWTEDGTIPKLLVDEIETLTGNPIGYGIINITVKVNAPGIDPIEETADGIIFYKFIWIK